MATPLTRAVMRRVLDEHGKPLYVTLTQYGIAFRRPRSKAVYMLSYGRGEVRAAALAHDGVGLPRAKKRR